MKEEPKQEEVEEKKEEIKKIEKEEQEDDDEEEHKETLSKNECIDVINSDDNIDELFGISVFTDSVIRFRIYTDLKNNNLKMILIIRLNLSNKIINHLSKLVE